MCTSFCSHFVAKVCGKLVLIKMQSDCFSDRDNYFSRDKMNVMAVGNKYTVRLKSIRASFPYKRRHLRTMGPVINYGGRGFEMTLWVLAVDNSAMALPLHKIYYRVWLSDSMCWFMYLWINPISYYYFVLLYNQGCIDKGFFIDSQRCNQLLEGSGGMSPGNCLF